MIKFIRLFFFVLSLNLNCVYAGVGLDSTRIIYKAGDRSVSVGVRNTDAKWNYLIQPSISKDLDGVDTVTPFVFSPALFKLQHGSEGIIKIMSFDQGAFPKDRESLFWLSVKAVPSSERSVSMVDFDRLKGGVKIAVGNTIKLIYRPEKLPGSPKDGAKGLTFEKTKAGKLKAKNASPYYVNINSLILNDVRTVSTNMMMVPPYGEIEFDGVTPPEDLKGIKWETINDNGGIEKHKL